MHSSSAGYPSVPRTSWLLLALLLAASLGAALTLSPSQPARATHLCAFAGSPAGPYDFTVYEARDYRKVYSEVMTLAGLNQLRLGDPFFDLPPLERGPRNNRTTGAAYIPPTLLKAIGWIESGWAQADFSVAYGSVGRVLLSHACAYGVMQIVTGMENDGDPPTPAQLLTGTNYVYNIARGARILVDKWNGAPELRPVVGQSNPQLLEDWYYAVWSYYGFTFSEHPLNPRFADPGQGGLGWPRPAFSCGPTNDGYGHDRSKYPYQELVFGCAAHPPQPGGTPLWQGVKVNLPDLSDPVVAAALDPENFQCGVDWDNIPSPSPTSTASPTPTPTGTYCFDNMDIPTPSYPGQPPHSDPSVATASRDAIVGSPRLSVAGPTSVSITVTGGSVPQPTVLTISNGGTGILSWMALTSHPWLRVSPWQSVSLGSDLGPRTSTLTITVDRSALPPGEHSGTVEIIAPMANGSPVTINVNVTADASSPPAAASPTPTPDLPKTEDVPLVADRCNPVVNTFASPTDVFPTLMDAVIEPRSDDTLWKYFPAENVFRGARRDAPAIANDLTTIDFLEPVSICRSEAPGIFQRPLLVSP